MDKDKMLVVTADSMATRGSGMKQLKIEELTMNINLFIEQMGNILEKAPEKLGDFHFDEFEIHAEITAQGAIAIMGTGLQASGGGGLRFVFRRSASSGSNA